MEAAPPVRPFLCCTTCAISWPSSFCPSILRGSYLSTVLAVPRPKQARAGHDDSHNAVGAEEGNAILVSVEYFCRDAMEQYARKATYSQRREKSPALESHAAMYPFPRYADDPDSPVAWQCCFRSSN